MFATRTRSCRAMLAFLALLIGIPPLMGAVEASPMAAISPSAADTAMSASCIDIALTPFATDSRAGGKRLDVLGESSAPAFLRQARTATSRAIQRAGDASVHSPIPASGGNRAPPTLC